MITINEPQLSADTSNNNKILGFALMKTGPVTSFSDMC